MLHVNGKHFSFLSYTRAPYPFVICLLAQELQPQNCAFMVQLIRSSLSLSLSLSEINCKSGFSLVYPLMFFDDEIMGLIFWVSLLKVG